MDREGKHEVVCLSVLLEGIGGTVLLAGLPTVV